MGARSTVTAGTEGIPRTDVRWVALVVLCLGELMIVLDSTIVNVALPAIRSDLGFSETSLAWVVNAYLLTSGGLLLLSGRLADLAGHRRLFLTGIGLFTAASVSCGLAPSPGVLVAGRVVQGVGGAVVSAAGLSLITLLFTEARERARAMGVFGFVAGGGATVGVLLGGVLTDRLDWHWVFLVNVPLGVGVIASSLRVLACDTERPERTKLDVLGALAITSALMLAVYAIINGNDVGWGSVRTIAELLGAVILLGLFIAREATASAPLMPLGLFRCASLTAANVTGVLVSAALFAWFFLAALYLQRVLAYTPLQVGLAFLPGSAITAASSLGVSARLVAAFGSRAPLIAGLLLSALGLALFARAPVTGAFLPDVLPGMVLLGIGGGIVINPLLLLAMSDVDEKDAGLASGLVNTSFMMGGALGLAAIVGVAAARSDRLLANGASTPAALTGGYHAAFLAGAGCALAAAIVAALALRAPAKGDVTVSP